MLLTTYSAYLILVMFITVLVARTLSKSGVAFLIDGFGGDETLARSINHLLVVGFYLINLGFAMMQMSTHRSIVTPEASLVFLSSKIGFVLVVLGAVHFFNLFVISLFKKAQIRHRHAQANIKALETKGTEILEATVPSQ